MLLAAYPIAILILLYRKKPKFIRDDNNLSFKKKKKSKANKKP